MTRYLTGSILTVALVVVTGCSQGNPAVPARISGKITYKGMPVKGGILRFHSEGGPGYDAAISRDGTYTATDIPAGELIITVDTEAVKPPTEKGKEAERRKGTMQSPPPGVAAPPPPEDLYVKIPAKYANPKSSPLTVNVKPGRNVHNIELTD